MVRVDNERYFSLELKGPLLPHVLPSLCFSMKSSQLEQYSASCARLESTTSFSAAKHGLGKSFLLRYNCNHAFNNYLNVYFYTLPEQKESENDPRMPQNIFGKENLSDCGFNDELIKHFCSPDPTHIQVLENITFSNNLYTWS